MPLGIDPDFEARVAKEREVNRALNAELLQSAQNLGRSAMLGIRNIGRRLIGREPLQLATPEQPLTPTQLHARLGVQALNRQRLRGQLSE